MKNRISSYFLYALGEIILVVIGILIALQINNWNQEVKAKKLKQVYIERLIADLESDVQMFQSYRESTEDKVKSGKAVIEIVESGSYEEFTDKHVFLMQSTARIGFPKIASNTFTDLQNSGNLKNFGSDSLLGALRSYYLDPTDFWKSIYVDRTTRTLLPIITDIIPMSVHERILDQEQISIQAGISVDFNVPYENFFCNSAEMEIIRREMKNSEELLFHLKNATRSHILQVRYNTSHLIRAQTLIENIKELKEND